MFTFFGKPTKVPQITLIKSCKLRSFNRCFIIKSDKSIEKVYKLAHTNSTPEYSIKN